MACIEKEEGGHSTPSSGLSVDCDRNRTVNCCELRKGAAVNGNSPRGEVRNSPEKEDGRRSNGAISRIDNGLSIYHKS